MKNGLLLILLVASLASCHFTQPKFQGGESFKMGGISGREVKMVIEGDVLNENGFGIKLKPSVFDMYVEDIFIGKVHLDEKLKLKRKQTTHLVAPVTVVLEQGVMFKAMSLIRKDKLKIQLKGEVKIGVFIFTKKRPIDEVKVINGIRM